MFFLSGFSALIYQLIWTRLAFASFGIITPVLSVVLSVFMLGLSVGAWVGGRWVTGVVTRTGLSAINFYGLAELLIGLGAFGVPKLFTTGERLLLRAGETNSTRYLCLSALVLAISILPWCLFMGATFPLMMAYIREQNKLCSDTFSYLYLANVLGAMTGTLTSALVLVELCGFHDSLQIAAAGNFIIALLCLRLGWGRKVTATAARESAPLTSARGILPQVRNDRATRRFAQCILFSTGFVSLALEVLWTRAFAPVLKTQVYSFALVVASYLGATFLGSALYRYQHHRNRTRSLAGLLGFVCVAAVLPLFADEICFPFQRVDEPYANPLSAVLLLVSICPFCALLGYLTPGLVDQYAGGSPAAAGSAYALNVLGCILGPLVASYLLLPRFSGRYALMVLVLPLFVFFVASLRGLPARRGLVFGFSVGAALAAATFFTRDFEEYFSSGQPHVVVRRDYAASVVSYGEGMDKGLLVNGNSMTRLTPVTKFMAHLPLALHSGSPQSALILCFGMGTTYRSALSWGIETTAVELVPSVKQAFSFYYADAEHFRHDPHGKIIIDDGRRYLRRTRARYDVIIIDPPPPVEAAGSSLLYSTEFYELAKEHLNRNGILQGWVPQDLLVACAALRSFCEAFPHVRCFNSVKGWGLHMLGSMEPIEQCSASELAARLPDAARADLLEWSSSQDLAAYLNLALAREIGTNEMLRVNTQIRITDDEPYNEYFLFRKLNRGGGRHISEAQESP